jgi:hypothetical protein
LYRKYINNSHLLCFLLLPSPLPLVPSLFRGLLMASRVFALVLHLYMHSPSLNFLTSFFPCHISYHTTLPLPVISNFRTILCFKARNTFLTYLGFPLPGTTQYIAGPQMPSYECNCTMSQSASQNFYWDVWHTLLPRHSLWPLSIWLFTDSLMILIFLLSKHPEEFSLEMIQLQLSVKIWVFHDNENTETTCLRQFGLI